MLSRPTTEQVLLDCRAELLATIEPAVADGPAKVAVQMLENVLRNCAARAAHEVAWMHEEGTAMIDFVERVATSPLGTPELDGALATYDSSRSDSRHLDDACATYDLAGRAFCVAVDAVMAGEGELADDLHRAGREVLELRLAHENEIMGEWAFVGRA
ncbi:hypothetical protein BH18ACT2_BH18ACT2_24740 [soil metagenome]